MTALHVGATVMIRDPRSNAARIATVVALSGDTALVEESGHVVRRSHHDAASLVAVAAARAALDRARNVGRQLGTAPLAIGHADALAAYIQHLEDRLTTAGHARSEGAAGAVPGAGR